jgi:hypothetical protein
MTIDKLPDSGGAMGREIICDNVDLLALGRNRVIPVARKECGEYSPTIPIFLSRLLSSFARSIRVIGRVPNFRLWPPTTSFRHHPSTASILNRNGRGGRPSTF